MEEEDSALPTRCSPVSDADQPVVEDSGIEDIVVCERVSVASNSEIILDDGDDNVEEAMKDKSVPEITKNLLVVRTDDVLG